MARLERDDALLVRVPNWLGDFVMAEPVLASLESALASGRFRRLSFAGPERFFDLLEGRFEEVTRLGPADDWVGHSVGIFLDGSLRSLWKAWRSGIDVRFSWNSGGRWLLATDGVRPALERGRTALGRGVSGRAPRRLPRPFGAACAQLVGLAGVPVVERAPLLRSNETARRAARGRLRSLGWEQDGPYLLLDASARKGSAKAAPVSLWLEVLEALGSRFDGSIVLASAPGEGALAREIHRAADGRRLLLYDEPPPTLLELLALMEDCEFFLGTDSGPRHLATASATPAVLLCGPTDPRHTADHTQHTQLIRQEVACGPCHREQCPLSRESGWMACMHEIPVRRILDGIDAVPMRRSFVEI